MKRNLIAVLLAYSTNLGLTNMAAASGISYDILSWTAEWYVREETLRAANLAIIGYHQRLPLTTVFGTGTLSSSDGQRFPTRGKSVTARAVNHFFAEEGLSTYTHVTDQHTTYGTKVIVTTRREAHYVLDEILGNATDLPVTEHATDTHGVTLVNFALFDLLGMQLSPRIRDLGKITLYRPVPRAEADTLFPHAGALLTRKLNLDLIAEHYDDLLRLAGSLKFGHATASLLVGKLSASGRQNALAAALKEYGAMRRTIYACRYLTDPDYRRKISRQLNKGESIHALKRGLLYAHEGAFRAYLALIERPLDQQVPQGATPVKLRLDLWLGTFLDSLRVQAGGRPVLLALSADHGVTSFPEFAQAHGRPGGRIGLGALVREVNRALAPRLGDSTLLEESSGLIFGDRERLRAAGVSPESLATTLAARVWRLPGVQNAWTPATLAGAAVTDLHARRWVRLLPPKFAWFVAAQARPGYIWADGPGYATHGTTNHDDVNVPLVFYGPGVRPGLYPDTVRTVDIAPQVSFGHRARLDHEGLRVLVLLAQQVPFQAERRFFHPVAHARVVFARQALHLAQRRLRRDRAFGHLRQHQPQLDQVDRRRHDVGDHVLGHQGLGAVPRKLSRDRHARQGAGAENQDAQQRKPDLACGNGTCAQQVHGRGSRGTAGAASGDVPNSGQPRPGFIP